MRLVVLRSGQCILTAGLGPSLSSLLGLLPGRWQARKISMEQPPVAERQSQAADSLHAKQSQSRVPVVLGLYRPLCGRGMSPIPFDSVLRTMC